MEFEYKATATFERSIDIENIAQCALELVDMKGSLCYLIVTTSLGVTRVLEHGPIVEYTDDISEKAVTKVSKFDYSSEKIQKLISIFINANKLATAGTEFVIEIPIEKALKSCVNLIESYKNQITETGVENGK